MEIGREAMEKDARILQVHEAAPAATWWSSICVKNDKNGPFREV
jgi:hypothetical protein